MGRTAQEKQKLLNRVRRIRGQLSATERVLEDEHGCVSTLQQIVSRRGATGDLLVGVLEDHVQTHLTEVDAEHGHVNDSAKDQLIEVVRNYFK